MFSVNKDQIYVFSNSRWTDEKDQPVEVSAEDEKEMCGIVADMESISYEGRGMETSLKGYRSISDDEDGMLADYLGVNGDDRFFVFKFGTVPEKIKHNKKVKGHEIPLCPKRAPGQSDEDYAIRFNRWKNLCTRNKIMFDERLGGSVYMMAEMHEIEIPSGWQSLPVKTAYIADLNGDVFNGGFDELLDIFIKWLDVSGAVAFSGDCMEQSSDMFLNRQDVKSKLKLRGFVDADELKEADEELNTRVFIKQKFWDGLTGRQKQLVRRYIEEIG